MKNGSEKDRKALNFQDEKRDFFTLFYLGAPGMGVIYRVRVPSHEERSSG